MVLADPIPGTWRFMPNVGAIPGVYFDQNYIGWKWKPRKEHIAKYFQSPAFRNAI